MSRNIRFTLSQLLREAFFQGFEAGAKSPSEHPSNQWPNYEPCEASLKSLERIASIVEAGS